MGVSYTEGSRDILCLLHCGHGSPPSRRGAGTPEISVRVPPHHGHLGEGHPPAILWPLRRLLAHVGGCVWAHRVQGTIRGLDERAAASYLGARCARRLLVTGKYALVCHGIAQLRLELSRQHGTTTTNLAGNIAQVLSLRGSPKRGSHFMVPGFPRRPWSGGCS